MKPLSSSPSSSSSSLLSSSSPLWLGSYLFSLVVFVVFVVNIAYDDDVMRIFRQPLQLSSSSDRPLAATEKREDHKLPFAIGESEESCDLFSGRWIRDESRPLYEESECPYIPSQLTCLKHGRPDKEFQYWRWQPHDCEIPRFNASLLLETLRGKRMMFAGDSLNRGQFYSMVCLLHSVIPEEEKAMEYFDSLTVFRAKSYNATIEYYWAPFLLESNSDHYLFHRVTDRIVRKGSINTHGRRWKGVDIVVFNTYLWWMNESKKIKFLFGSFDDEVKNIVEMATEDGYRVAIKSMLRWVRTNMDPKRTRVFFASMSPTHEHEDWGGKTGENCYKETTMIEENKWNSSSSQSIMQVIGQVFSKSKVNITFLNITQLSEYRKDAHLSIYREHWTPLTPEQLANPVSYADCAHWCLPGLHDTWNELLFAKLLYP